MLGDNDVKNFTTNTLPILQKHLDAIQAIKSENVKNNLIKKEMQITSLFYIIFYIKISITHTCGLFQAFSL